MKKNTVKQAVNGIAEELRNMNVGDVLRFDLTKYKYTSIRSSPKSSLIDLWLDGRRWTTKLDVSTKSALVTREA